MSVCVGVKVENISSFWWSANATDRAFRQYQRLSIELYTLSPSPIIPPRRTFWSHDLKPNNNDVLFPFPSPESPPGKYVTFGLFANTFAMSLLASILLI